MRCSHCGGSIVLPPDPSFDDHHRCVIVDGEERPVPSQAYRVIELLRSMIESREIEINTLLAEGRFPSSELEFYVAMSCPSARSR